MTKRLAFLALLAGFGLGCERRSDVDLPEDHIASGGAGGLPSADGGGSGVDAGGSGGSGGEPLALPDVPPDAEYIRKIHQALPEDLRFLAEETRWNRPSGVNPFGKELEVLVSREPLPIRPLVFDIDCGIGCAKADVETLPGPFFPRMYRDPELGLVAHIAYWVKPVNTYLEMRVPYRLSDGQVLEAFQLRTLELPADGISNFSSFPQPDAILIGPVRDATREPSLIVGPLAGRWNFMFPWVSDRALLKCSQRVLLPSGPTLVSGCLDGVAWMAPGRNDGFTVMPNFPDAYLTSLKAHLDDVAFSVVAKDRSRSSIYVLNADRTPRLVAHDLEGEVCVRAISPTTIVATRGTARTNYGPCDDYYNPLVLLVLDRVTGEIRESAPFSQERLRFGRTASTFGDYFASNAEDVTGRFAWLVRLSDWAIREFPTPTVTLFAMELDDRHLYFTPHTRSMSAAPIERYELSHFDQIGVDPHAP